jgi:hypothetical protein
MFKGFILVSVCYISYGGFQTKVYKIGGCYSVHMTKNEKLILYENSVSLIPLWSRYYLQRRWTHHFTYTDVATPHNRMDATLLAAGTQELDNDPIAFYLGYYDWGPQRQL